MVSSLLPKNEQKKFVHFLGRIEDTKKTFRNFPTWFVWYLKKDIVCRNYEKDGLTKLPKKKGQGQKWMKAGGIM